MRFLREYTREDLARKRVLLRVDYNVEVVHEGSQNTIQDDFRLRSSFASIDFLLKNDARVIVLAHLGDPTHEDLSLSLFPVFEQFKKQYPEAVFARTFEELEACIKNGSSLILFENVRFLDGEKDNSEALAQKLASFGDVYINDAFSVSHRKNASVVGIAQFLPHAMGFQMEKEITNLEKLLNEVERPFVCVVGGAKMGTKIPLIKNLLHRIDYMLLGSGVSSPLLKEKGYHVGTTIYEEVDDEDVKQLLSSPKVILPKDFVLQGGDTVSMEGTPEISEGAAILDIGEKTIADFTRYITEAKTILWNGPLGFFEDPRFRVGSEEIARAIAASSAVTFVGGGETVALIHELGLSEQFDFISTGGGAMIAYLSGEKLPGIEALK